MRFLTSLKNFSLFFPFLLMLSVGQTFLSQKYFSQLSVLTFYSLLQNVSQFDKFSSKFFYFFFILETFTFYLEILFVKIKGQYYFTAAIFGLSKLKIKEKKNAFSLNETPFNTSAGSFWKILFTVFLLLSFIRF